MTFTVVVGMATLVALSLTDHPRLGWDVFINESITRFMTNLASSAQVVLAIATVATLVILLRQFGKQKEEAHRAANEEEWRITLTGRTSQWKLDAGRTEFIKIDLHYGGQRAIHGLSMHCSEPEVELVSKPPLSVLLGPTSEIPNATWIYQHRLQGVGKPVTAGKLLEFVCTYVDSLDREHHQRIKVGASNG